MIPIEITIKFKTSFLIGSGFGLAGELDNTAMKDGNQIVFIPGTSIKGVIRDACVNIAKIRRWNCYDRVIDEINDIADQNKDIMDPKNHSYITQIFGSPLIPSLFDFGSVYLNPADDHLADLIRKTVIWSEGHNKINPETRTVLKGHFYAHEVSMSTEGGEMVDGYSFKCNITPLQNSIDDKLISLLFCGIRLADRLGAKKSRGKGVVEFVVPENYSDKSLKEWMGITFN